MSAAKKYIVSHMEKYCGPLYCLPQDVRENLTPATSIEASKTFRFYFAVFCARNGIPVDLCVAYCRVYGLTRSSFGINHVRRIFGEAIAGMHLDYYAYICDANSCVDPQNGEKIQSKFMVGKTASYRVYELQKSNTAPGSKEGYTFHM